MGGGGGGRQQKGHSAEVAPFMGPDLLRCVSGAEMSGTLGARGHQGQKVPKSATLKVPAHGSWITLKALKPHNVQTHVPVDDARHPRRRGYPTAEEGEAAPMQTLYLGTHGPDDQRFGWSGGEDWTGDMS